MNKLILFCIITFVALHTEIHAEVLDDVDRDTDRLMKLLDSQVACGVQCLYAAARLSNIDVEQIEVAKRANLREEGISLWDIKMAAENIGFVATGYKCSMTEWKDLKPLTIVQTKTKDVGHFLLVVNVTNQGWSVIDPPKKHYCLTVDEINKQWTGNVLELEPPKTVKSTISLDSPIDLIEDIDLGSVSANRSISIIINIHNNLGVEAKILKCQYSCSCIGVDLPEQSLLAVGETKSVPLMFKTSQGMGGFLKALVVFLQAGGEDFKVITRIKGVVPGEGNLLAFPDRLDINVVKGEHKKANILIRREENEKLLFKKVLSSEPWLMCKKIEDTYQNSEDRIKLEVTATNYGSMKMGVHEGKISVVTDDIRHSVIDVPVTCRVISPIKIEPIEVICKMSKSQEEERCLIVLDSYDGNKVEVDKIEFIPTSLGKIYNILNPHGSSVTLEVAINKPNSAKYSKGMIHVTVCHLGVKYIDKIPVAVIIE